jgi:cell division protein FtsB
MLTGLKDPIFLLTECPKMIDYLINVALGMAAPTVASITVVIASLFFRKFLKKKHEKATKWFIEGVAIAWFISLALIMVDSSITYKHEPFDKLQEQNKIEMINKAESEEAAVIKDLSKPIEANNREDFEKLVDYTK